MSGLKAFRSMRNDAIATTWLGAGFFASNGHHAGRDEGPIAAIAVGEINKGAEAPLRQKPILAVLSATAADASWRRADFRRESPGSAPVGRSRRPACPAPCRQLERAPPRRRSGRATALVR